MSLYVTLHAISVRLLCKFGSCAKHHQMGPHAGAALQWQAALALVALSPALLHVIS